MSEALCRVADIPAEGALVLEGGLFAVQAGGGVAVYVNACPHLGVRLDWLPGRFLSADGQHIVCAMHGAVFRRADGVCLRGPCRGERLTAVRFSVRDGMVIKERRQGRLF